MATILRLPAVKQQTGMSTSQIYTEMDAGRFPPPARLFEGARACGWFSDEIDAYVEARRKARDKKLEERGQAQRKGGIARDDAAQAAGAASGQVT
jgi:prophage regulatory protein